MAWVPLKKQAVKRVKKNFTDFHKQYNRLLSFTLSVWASIQKEVLLVQGGKHTCEHCTYIYNIKTGCHPACLTLSEKRHHYFSATSHAYVLREENTPIAYLGKVVDGQVFRRPNRCGRIAIVRECPDHLCCVSLRVSHLFTCAPTFLDRVTLTVHTTHNPSN